MCPSHFSNLDFGWFRHHIHTSDYNPTGVCWRLMPGPCQERHLSVHHLGVGKPWANGRANPSTHGWDVDAKFGQRGTGNGKPSGPSRPGQRNSRNSVWRAVLIMCCFRNSSDIFHLDSLVHVVTSWARTRPWLVRADPQLAANEFWHLTACRKIVQRLGVAQRVAETLWRNLESRNASAIHLGFGPQPPLACGQEPLPGSCRFLCNWLSALPFTILYMLSKSKELCGRAANNR